LVIFELIMDQNWTELVLLDLSVTLQISFPGIKTWRTDAHSMKEWCARDQWSQSKQMALPKPVKVLFT